MWIIVPALCYFIFTGWHTCITACTTALWYLKVYLSPIASHVHCICGIIMCVRMYTNVQSSPWVNTFFTCWYVHVQLVKVLYYSSKLCMYTTELQGCVVYKLSYYLQSHTFLHSMCDMSDFSHKQPYHKRILPKLKKSWKFGGILGMSPGRTTCFGPVHVLVHVPLAMIGINDCICACWVVLCSFFVGCHWVFLGSIFQ